MKDLCMQERSKQGNFIYNGDAIGKMHKRFSTDIFGFKTNLSTRIETQEAE